MQQLLPLMLDWLSHAPDPDLGLAQLRLLVTTSPDNAALLGAMRDNPVAAERLCTLLGTSRVLSRLLDRIPPFLARLGNDAGLDAFPDRARLVSDASARIALREGPVRTGALRRFAEEHLLWIASLDLAGRAGSTRVGMMLTDTADALVAGALAAAADEISQTSGVQVPHICVIAQGKWGGGELNYSSDLDGQVVFAGSDAGAGTAEAAARVAERMVDIMQRISADGLPFHLDLDLRPEGKRGVLARSVESTITYYHRWADTWEFQALLRARLAAGPSRLSDTFFGVIEPLVFREDFGSEHVREIRRMKARVETERIPPDEDPDFNAKLGRGGMADVEWTAPTPPVAAWPPRCVAADPVYIGRPRGPAGWPGSCRRTTHGSCPTPTNSQPVSATGYSCRPAARGTRSRPPPPKRLAWHDPSATTTTPGPR